MNPLSAVPEATLAVQAIGLSRTPSQMVKVSNTFRACAPAFLYCHMHEIRRCTMGQDLATTAARCKLSSTRRLPGQVAIFAPARIGCDGCVTSSSVDNHLGKFRLRSTRAYFEQIVT